MHYKNVIAHKLYLQRFNKKQFFKLKITSFKHQRNQFTKNAKACIVSINNYR